MKLSLPYHLPHNSIRIDEFDFMLNSIDCKKEFYTYEELRLHFLKKEIQENVFHQFHPGPHKNLLKHKNEQIRELYKQARLCNEKCCELLSPQLRYTSAKSFKQVWNEFVRDYTEFFAFIGLLPCYYKGGKGGKKCHYVSDLVKQYKDKKITVEQLLFMFKYRNASKDEKSLEMYHIEVRPFVLALKALQLYKANGKNYVNPQILSAIVSYSHDEFEDFSNVFASFPDPSLKLKECKDAFASFKTTTEKEIGRVTLLIKPYLKSIGLVSVERIAGCDYYKIEDKVIGYKYENNCAFCDGEIGKYKLTPLIGKVLKVCEINAGKALTKKDIFDSNFSDADVNEVLKELKQLGVVNDFDERMVNIASLENQFQVNPYTDFRSIEEGNYVNGRVELNLVDSQQDSIIQLQKLDLDDLRAAALSSDGSAYEEILSETLKEKITAFSNTIWYGSAQTGKRLSDIACPVSVFTKGERKTILIVVECKASGAIKAFDERKEREDIINTLKKFEKYDGVWYWVTDSNSLPECNVHGGYRNNGETKSFLEKLNELQFEISEETHRPAIVTAFSIDALTSYLNYLYQSTSTLEVGDCITETQVPHFWRWSKKFMNVQYVTIHKQINL